MKVIFLDFDGVLNSDSEPNPPFNPLIVFGSPKWISTQLDPLMMKRLNFIIKESGALVVLSTSWRETHSLHKLYEALKTAGFQGLVIGSTPAGDRAEGIRAWLEAVDAVTEYVILDDAELSGLEARHVRTSMSTGLGVPEVVRALELLGVDPTLLEFDALL